MKKGTEVIIIGAGVIGAACAWRLAETGAEVVVYDRNAPGSGASQAALGVLGFHARPEMSEAVDQLCRLSGSYYPAVVEELANKTGMAVDFKAGGQLSVAFSEEDVAELEALYDLNASMDIEVVRPTLEESLQLAPGINPDLKGAVFFPADAWIDNTGFTLAMVEAAKRAGARFQRGEVNKVIQNGERQIEVVVNGQSLAAKWAVLAAGCWSGSIGGPAKVPVEPVRGQALMVAAQPIRRIVMSPRGYLVPKGDSQTMLGATVEKVGFEEANTLGGINEVASAGLEMAPILAKAEFIGAWAGLRPAAIDDQPLIGPFKRMPKVIAATGHFRHGILLAPITADMVQSIIAGTEAPAAWEPFSPNRLSQN